MRRWLTLLLVLAAGCRSSADPPPVTTTTLLPVPETTTTIPATTTTTDPFAVPAVIDVAYAQRVLENIYRLDGEAVRYAYAKKVLDAELDARLVAIFGGPALEEARRILKENAAERFVRFADPPGYPKVSVIEIVQATPLCMVVRANLDFGSYYKRVQAPDPQVVVELRTADVEPFNPTGWGVLVAGRPRPGTNVMVC